LQEIYGLNWHPQTRFDERGVAERTVSSASALARRVAATTTMADPNFTVARFRNERRSENPTFLAQRERIYEGLSLAGVPEGK
jgi:hypothetical protein